MTNPTRMIPTTSEQLKVLPLVCRCPGGKRRLPLRFAPWVVEFIRQHDPNRLAGSYRCSDCGGVVRIAAGDMNGASTT